MRLGLTLSTMCGAIGSGSRRALRAAALALIAIFASISLSAADDQESAEAVFIRSLADRATQALRDESRSLEERESHFRSLLQEGFALKKIGRFVVGRYWRQMTPEQQADYLQLFGEWVVRTYSSRLGGYADQSFEVVKTVDTGDSDIFVRTRLDHPDYAKPINIDWRVRKYGDRFKILDVVIEGISMLITQRQEFGAVLGKSGVEGLIETMRVRVSKFPATAG